MHWDIVWGDGTVEQLSGDPANATHVYTVAGVYTIQATATDEDDTYASNTLGVTAHPVPSVTGNSSVNEGEIYTLNLDIDGSTADEWTINWGDGTSPESVPGNQSSIEHIYADGEAARTIVATAHTSMGDYDATLLHVDVHNVDPTLVINGDSQTNVNESYILTLNASDPGDDQMIQWDIHWGDGTSDTILGNPNEATHAYTSAGDYVISATATDEDDTFTATTQNVTVDPVLSIGGNTSIDEGSTYTLNLAIQGIAADTWIINWGDETTPEQVHGNQTTVNHVFADGDAARTIIATAHTALGDYEAAPVVVEIINVEPVLTISGDASVNVNVPYVISLQVNDPGDDTIYPYLCCYRKLPYPDEGH
jgi:hypothetical protein